MIGDDILVSRVEIISGTNSFLDLLLLLTASQYSYTAVERRNFLVPLMTNSLGNSNFSLAYQHPLALFFSETGRAACLSCQNSKFLVLEPSAWYFHVRYTVWCQVLSTFLVQMFVASKSRLTPCIKRLLDYTYTKVWIDVYV